MPMSKMSKMVVITIYLKLNIYYCKQWLFVITMLRQASIESIRSSGGARPVTK